MEIVANLTALRARPETFNGRSFLVAPVTLIVPGVLNGSRGPLYYPPDEVARRPADWNNIPIVVYHPVGPDGSPVSARSPRVLETQGVGFLFNATAGGKLKAEGWFDVQRTREVDGRVLAALERGTPMEISTGLELEQVPAPHGAVHNGPGGPRPYVAVARNYRPDHLAVLPDRRGACALADGCGLHVNAGAPGVVGPGHALYARSTYFQGLALLAANANPKQPRVPAGSPQGGQFAPSKGDRVAVTGGEHAGKSGVVLAAYKTLPKVFLKLDTGGRVHVHTGHLAGGKGAAATGAGAGRAGGAKSTDPRSLTPGDVVKFKHELSGKVLEGVVYEHNPADEYSPLGIESAGGFHAAHYDDIVKVTGRRDEKVVSDSPSKKTGEGYTGAGVSAAEKEARVVGGKVEGTPYTKKQLFDKAIQAGRKLYGEGLDVGPLKKVYVSTLAEALAGKTGHGVVDDYEYVFHPSTGKGLDVAGQSWHKGMADKDGNIYSALDDAVFVIKTGGGGAGKKTRAHNQSGAGPPACFAGLTLLAANYDPEQPREPAGSSKGGQFAHKVGGRITVTSGPHAGKSGVVLAAYKTLPKLFVKFDTGGRHHLAHGEVVREGASDGGRGNGAGGGAVRGADARAGGSVAGQTGGPGGAKAGQGGDAAGQSSGHVAPERVPAGAHEVVGKIGRFADFFRSRGQHEVAAWLDKVRDHVEAVGPAAALEALGAAKTPGAAGKPGGVQYWGVGTEEANWKSMGDWMEKYLQRNGITAVTGEHSSPDSPLISALGKPDRYVAGQDFKTTGGVFEDKLEEARHLPGLEKSRDISELMGKPITHLTQEVTDKLDKHYGKGQWVVKCYDDNAAAGYGIFFPQRVASIVQKARSDIWESGEKLSQYGFTHHRDETGKVVGIKHKDGTVYHFDDALTALRSSPDIGGNEHEVREDSKGNRFYKITKEGNFGYSRDLGEYLTRHQIANEMWPELGYSFHGITEDHQGRPRAVMSMNRIEGEHPENHEVNQWFGKRGFEPVFEHDKGWRGWDPKEGYYVEQWRDPKTGTIFADAASQNFIKTAGGGLVPIDLDIKPGKDYEPGKISHAASVGGGKGGGARGAGKVAGDDAGAASGVHPPQSGPTPLGAGISPAEALGALGGAAGGRAAIDAAKASGHHIEPSNYERTIHGDARSAGDVARGAAGHENGAMLPEGSFMAQPAFPAVGISDADRAAGKTWHGTNEGRVHLVTRENGDVEVIPHATWLKGGSLPVVFESEHTRAMAQAALEAVRQLPAGARKGQVYAPDVMRTGDGFKVVELNAQGDYNGSGYLHDNHFTIDAFTSHVTGRDPLHVSFIRNLLTKRAPGTAGRAATPEVRTGAGAGAKAGAGRLNVKEGDRVKITGGEHAGKTGRVIAAYRKLPKVFLKLEGGGRAHVAHDHLAHNAAPLLLSVGALQGAIRAMIANAGGIRELATNKWEDSDD